MTLSELKNSFVKDANLIDDLETLSLTEIANKYCDLDELEQMYREPGNKDDLKAEIFHIEKGHYFSAMMVHYWYKIFDWIQNSQSLKLDSTEFVEWLRQGIWVAFYYRTWRYEYEAIVIDGVFKGYKLDENGEKKPNPYYYILDNNSVDKIMNRCIATIRGKEYQYHNKDKRKANVQTYSLDQMNDENGDSALDYSGAVTKPKIIEETKSYALVSEFLKRGEYIEALVIDGIANHDSVRDYKVKRSITTYDPDTNEELKNEIIAKSYKFDPRKLVKHLSNINLEFIKKFCNDYSLDKADAQEMFTDLSKTSNAKLYRCIDKTLKEIRNNDQFLDTILD